MGFERRIIMKIKDLIQKYNHAWVFLYGLIYIPWFSYLEKTVTTHFFEIHSKIDDFIPFIEYFIVPYLLWFVYLIVCGLFIFFTDKKEFYKMAAFGIIGMTLFLIICTVFPNGLHLRPTTFARDNVFVDLVKRLYATDTPTNVLPSIHVYNSLTVAIAVNRSKLLENKRWIKICSSVLAFLIILSTVFLKQHSITDVICAFAIAAPAYCLIYAPSTSKSHTLAHNSII